MTFTIVKSIVYHLRLYFIPIVVHSPSSIIHHCMSLAIVCYWPLYVIDYCHLRYHLLINICLSPLYGIPNYLSFIIVSHSELTIISIVCHLLLSLPHCMLFPIVIIIVCHSHFIVTFMVYLLPLSVIYQCIPFTHISHCLQFALIYYSPLPVILK